jgi:hypothetical protein
VDETTLSLHPRLRRCCVKRSQPKLIPAPGRPLHYHGFRAYNWHFGTVAWLDTIRKNSESFIAFLEQLAFSVYADERLIQVDG